MNKIVYITDLPKEQYDNIDIIEVADLNLNTFTDYEAIFVRFNKHYRDIVKKIRRHHQTNIYLKPIYLYKQPNEHVIEFGKEILDGIIERNDFFNYYSSHKVVIDEINNRINDLLTVTGENENNEFSLALRVLRYMYTRQRELKPVRFVRSIYGYSYPNVNVNFSGNSFQEFAVTDFLEERGYIKGEFVDRIFSCNSCYSSFLNFREVCTNCGSADIASEDLIHHYVCGYVGPESDYQTDEIDELKCPKCKKHLKHIGVDYDRPSEIFTCNSCQHQFQEPEVSTLCLNCGSHSEPDKLITRNLKNYSLTAIGENSAIHGIMYSLRDDLMESLEILDQNKLKIALKMEVERVRRYKKSISTLVRLHFKNYLELQNSYGNNAINISYEIGKVINEALRKSDLIAYINKNIFTILLTETDLTGAKELIKRLDNSLKDIQGINLDVELKIEYLFIEINEEQEFDTVIDSLLKDV